MSKQTKNSKAYSKRAGSTVHPSFPQPGQEQAANLGSQSMDPGQQDGYQMPGSPLGPSQDMSFGQTN